MIDIANNQVTITIENTFLIQKFNPETGNQFQTEADCFQWVVSSGWFDRFKQFVIKGLKDSTTISIFEHAPIFKQVNAALGVYSDEEINEIRTIIKNLRDEANTKEEAILNAKTLDEVKSYLKNDLY